MLPEAMSTTILHASCRGGFKSLRQSVPKMIQFEFLGPKLQSSVAASFSTS